MLCARLGAMSSDTTVGPDGSTAPDEAGEPGEAHLPGPRTAPAGDRRAAFARAVLHWAAVLLVAVCGAAFGAALAPSTKADVGPLLLDVRVVPSLHPGVRLLLPPVGRVDFDTHAGPVAVEARVTEVDVEAAKELLSDPRGLVGLQVAAPEALRSATIRAAGWSAGCALLGACGLSLLVHRRMWRRTAQVAGGLVAVLVATGVTAVVTFDADALAQPRFTGLLSRAPYVTSQANGLIERLESYRAGLADIVQGVTALYATSGELPVAPDTGDDVVRVLHISDVHLNPLAFDLVDRLVQQFNVDLVVDTGDITTWGTEIEGATLSRIRNVKVPYVFVRGNHDSRLTQAAVAANRNAIVLDDEVVEVDGIVLAGIGDPTFTPDSGTEPDGTPASAAATPSGRATPTLAAGAAPSGDATAAPTQPATDPQVLAGERLAATVRTWDDAHPGKPVDIAMVHEPRSAPALFGTVPLVLAGHLHRRVVTVDPSGTRLMVQGSTGGAGITAGNVDRMAQGKPVPLTATLVYIARSGERARQVVAYDDVTVGGFGLASVSLERTVVRAEDAPALPSPGATPTAAGGTATAVGRRRRSRLP